MVTVFQTADPVALALAKGALESAGIPFVSEGEGLQDLIGLGRFPRLQRRDRPREDSRGRSRRRRCEGGARGYRKPLKLLGRYLLRRYSACGHDSVPAADVAAVPHVGPWRHV